MLAAQCEKRFNLPLFARYKYIKSGNHPKWAPRSLACRIRSVCLSPFSCCRLSPVVCRATREYVVPTRVCYSISENEKAWNDVGKAFDKHNFCLGERRTLASFITFPARTSSALLFSFREDTLMFTFYWFLLYAHFYYSIIPMCRKTFDYFLINITLSHTYLFTHTLLTLSFIRLIILSFYLFFSLIPYYVAHYSYRYRTSFG